MNHFKSNVDQHTINMHFLCSINKAEKKTSYFGFRKQNLSIDSK